MPRCFVLNCGNYYNKTKTTEVMYHVFPMCKKVALKWLGLCRGKDSLGSPPKYARVCSRHFSPNCYQRDLQHELLGLPIRKKLKSDALPDLNLPGNAKDNKTKKLTVNKQNTLNVANNTKINTKDDFLSLPKCKLQVQKLPKIEKLVKPENIFDAKNLPVRSSIRIAKRKSIECISGSGENKQPKNVLKSPEEFFREKVEFMSTFNLVLGESASKNCNKNEDVPDLKPLQKYNGKSVSIVSPTPANISDKNSNYGSVIFIYFLFQTTY